jgi:hypothetical protein
MRRDKDEEKINKTRKSARRSARPARALLISKQKYSHQSYIAPALGFVTKNRENFIAIVRTPIQQWVV